MHDKNPIIIKNIESIKQFHPEASIAIIDSCSQNKSYIDIIKKQPYENVYIEVVCNQQYEYGAFMHSYAKYKNFYDIFIFIQDSLILTGPIDEQLKLAKENNIVCLLGHLHFNGCDGCEEIMDIKKIHYPNNKLMTVWNSFIINNFTFNKAINSSIFNAIKPPTNKNGSRGWERAWTIVWENAGIEIAVATQNIQKIFLNRQ